MRTWQSENVAEPESGRARKWQSKKVAERESGRAREWQSNRVAERESDRTRPKEKDIIKGTFTPKIFTIVLTP